MKEPMFQNNHKINREAKAALQSLNLEPDPASLYVLQLLNWAQQSQKLKAKDSRLWDQVDEMTAWAPNKVMDLIQTEPGTGERVSLELEDLEPIDLARVILEQVNAWMVENAPTYLEATR